MRNHRRRSSTEYSPLIQNVLLALKRCLSMLLALSQKLFGCKELERDLCVMWHGWMILNQFLSFFFPADFLWVSSHALIWPYQRCRIDVLAICGQHTCFKLFSLKRMSLKNKICCMQRVGGKTIASLERDSGIVRLEYMRRQE